MKSSIEVSAVYFPTYHRTAHNDSWYGEGWTEWELVKKAPPISSTSAMR